MKVLYITPFYPPAYGFGGPVVVAQSVATAVARKGNQVTVVTTDTLDASSRIALRHEERDGVNIYRLRNLSSRLAKDFNLYLPIGFARFISRLLPDFQVVHLHAFFTYLNVRAVGYCRRMKIPYVLHLHESPVPLAVLGKTRIKRVFNFLWGKSILRNASQILVISSREKELLVEYLPELAGRITVLPNQLSENLPAAKADRASLQLKASAKVILSLSRLSRIKRIDAAVRGLHELVKKDANYQLLIAGGDEAGTQKELENLVTQLGLNDHVHFLGEVDAKQRAGLFSVADIYLLLSRYESFSISTLESLYYEVPVCLSKEVGVAADIIPAGCGVVVADADSPIAVAEMVAQTYQQRHQLASNCRLALKPFQTEDRGDQVIKIYHQLLGLK